MKKVLVVQPVENRTQEERSNDLNEAYKYLIDKGFEPVCCTSPLISDKIANALGVKNIYLYHIGNIFDYMSKVDCVYFTGGWILDKICRIIRLASILYDIEILEKEEKN